jgi:hypothetical protein
MNRRTLLATLPFSLAGCLGSGSGSDPTPSPMSTSPAPTRTQPATPTVTSTPSPKATPESTTQLAFDPQGATVVAAGDATTVGPFRFRVTDQVHKREIRHYDAARETVSRVSPRGERTVWFQAGGSVTNVSESQVRAPTLDAFRIHQGGGSDPPVYRIDAVGPWQYLGESETESPIVRPGWDPRTAYLVPDASVRFEALFVVREGSPVYLEFDARGTTESSFVRFDPVG